MKIIEFFMPMIPPTVTAQEREIRVVKGKPVVYDTAEIDAAKQKLRAHFAPHAPAEPFDGPVRLIAKWCWPCAGTRHADGEWKITKPDVDNITKMQNDVMEKLGFFTNDSRVASGMTEKFWADVPGIYIRIEELS